MQLISSTFNWLMSKRMKGVEHFMRYPLEVQSSVFQYLLAEGRRTAYGRQYGFADITTPEQYRNQVPIVPYEELYPYILRMMKGEQNILWPSEIRWFSKSSGTTNAKSKFIPVSTEALEECHYKAGKDMIAIYVSSRPESQVLWGKTLAIGGSYQRNHLNSQSYYGDVSAIIMKNLPIWAEFMRTPSLEVALMSKWEEKLEKMAAMSAKENVVNISGVPTWTIVILQRILELTGKSNILEVWPNLELFTHGAVAFGPYRETFKKLIPSAKMNYLEIYNASEGFFGIQDTAEPDEMLLLLDYGVYYEFIPSEEIGKEQPQTVGLDQVEVGKNYAVVISTNAGLWRYLIGDTVRFTSTAPYRIKISGRTKHFINAFGEEVVVENAETAIVAACTATGAKVNNFTAAPIYLEAGKKGGHEWVIEFEQRPDNLEKFVYYLDEKLKEVNSDYEAKRYQDIALVKPVVHEADSGTFYEWMRRRGKLGGQNKVPRLANNREYIDDILQLMTELQA